MATIFTFDGNTKREMTAAEKNAYLAFAEEARAEAEAQIEAVETKAAARQAVLDKLGLTAAEADALFG